METPKRDKPWIMRTYAGYNTARASNELYRGNIAKGQTGLSVAFDLPTQTGYDSDHPLARGEVGKVGVPICHIEDMETLFRDIPLGQMNTSMTINAPAAWLLALYIAAAERQGANRRELTGTTQNDIMKEALARGTYIFPPDPSLRLTRDVIRFTVDNVPKWNPLNICSYHLQEAGATPVQELAFALANALMILDPLKADEGITSEQFTKIFGRFSFFVNSGIRLIEEICKMRAFVELWDEIGRTRYGIEDPKSLLFRYGVQVNSLGLTAQQPENNVARIIIEMLGVVLSKNARARSVQLPAWNEAHGLPRPWDQQWSLRIQQILGFETDILEFGDIFDGNPVIEAKVADLKAAARKKIEEVLAQNDPEAAVGLMKMELVGSNAARLRAIESGDIKVVGVNCFQESEPCPLLAGMDGGIFRPDSEAERDQVERLYAFRDNRDTIEVARARRALHDAATNGDNIMPASIAAALAGVTTGEWAETLRQVFGEYRAPTGIGIQIGGGDTGKLDAIRARVDALSEKRGRRLKVLIGKPGLDGHSNGAEQIAVRFRDCGFEVVYMGIRLTPEAIVRSAIDEGVHLIGLSVLSGSHMELVGEIIRKLHIEEFEYIPLILGGIIPDADHEALKKMGVVRIYTPRNYDINAMIEDILSLLETPAAA